MSNNIQPEIIKSKIAQWEMVIGIEVHVQLNTRSKIFSGSSTLFGQTPNTQASIVDLGMPGALPVLNKEVVKKAIQFGLAINASLNSPSIFERKNYFYPDLPKGYQISQFQTPIVGKGYLEINLPDGKSKIIHITRAHLEEDAGKSIHNKNSHHTEIDLNRAGMPLLEIVSEPELRSATEAVEYLKTLHELVTALDISDGNMQEGSFRADLNISLRPFGQEKFGTRTEIKNVNSFKFAFDAIEYEFERQKELLESGQKIIQETRLYDADKNQTRSMRSKEDSQDYRYFPDPDLPPLFLDKDWIQAIKQAMPELPAQRKSRYLNLYALSKEEIQQITKSNQLIQAFEYLIQEKHAPKLISNWLKHWEQANQEHPIELCVFSSLLSRIEQNIISNTAGKQVLAELIQGKTNVDEIIQDLGLLQISDSSELENLVQKIIQEHPEQVAELKSGKEKLLGYLVGQAMKASAGKANPGELKAILLKILKI